MFATTVSFVLETTNVSVSSTINSSHVHPGMMPHGYYSRNICAHNLVFEQKTQMSSGLQVITPRGRVCLLCHMPLPTALRTA